MYTSILSKKKICSIYMKPVFPPLEMLLLSNN